MPETDDYPKGPEIGDQLPDFTLLDQHSNPVTFSQVRAGQKALVMFHRSARW
jgi:peroxiredoxin